MNGQPSSEQRGVGNGRVGPGMVQGALRIFDLALGEMLWSRRTIFMALVVGGPVVLGAVFRILAAAGIDTFRINRTPVAGATIFGMMIWVLYLRFIVPVLGAFYGTSLIADEVEDKTITYLFTRPIPRGAILLGKYVAYLTCTGLVVLPSVMLLYFLVVPLGGGSLAAAFPALLKDMSLLALGLAVYGAVFAYVGARLKRPLVVGLIFAFGWEPLALAIPGYLRRFTVAYYLQALVPHAVPQDSALGFLQAIFRGVPSVATCLVWLALFWIGFLALAARAVASREYVLEQ